MVLWEIYNNEDFHIFYITFGKSENLMTMKRLVFLLALLLMVPAAVSAQDDYAKRKADGYIREAESYQSKADSYRIFHKRKSFNADMSILFKHFRRACRLRAKTKILTANI